MRNKIVSVFATALMAGGMMFASTVGTLPGSTAGVDPSGSALSVNSAAALPGVVSTQETPTQGLASNGVRPGVGVQTGATGSASPSSNSLPGVETASLVTPANNF